MRSVGSWWGLRMSAYVVSCVARRFSASIQRTLHCDVSWKRFLRRRVAAFAEGRVCLDCYTGSACLYYLAG
jgi:hypothetical protein